MRIRFYNARILTMKDNSVIIGELWTNDSKIEYVGECKPSNFSFDREIDCNLNLLMPGLKDAHTHTAMTFARSLADNYSLNDWLFKAIFPREAKLTPEHIYWFTKLGFADYISGGITSCFDMYFHPDSVTKAAVEMGFRNVFCGSVNDFGGIDRLENEYEKFNSVDPLVSFQLGFHAEYTTSKDLMNRISDIAHKYEAPVFAHISETSSEVDGCKERYGMTPPVLLDKLGMFDFGGGGFHCVWMSDEDVEVFKRRKLWAVSNACSNLKLASGIAPISKFISSEINLAIGTDGAGSNNSLSMFREMYLSTVLSNVVNNDPTSVDPFKILTAGTVGGARCMGLTDCDYLEEGKQADIIMIDMNKPSMQPENNIVNNIVYSSDNSVVKMTMIAGRILYEDGVFSTIDFEETKTMCNKLIKDLND
ncbi:MAG: amidohydrolase [Saccharofermentans sp.]|nr:amidohydrolase [Saccharofermentans sp.]